MGLRIPALLEGILAATAAEAAAKARIATLRAVLEDEGRRRLKAEGAAPAWNTPQLGKVRLDPPGPWEAVVADEAAFGSFVAEHHPSEATAVLRIPADTLEAALEALTFAGFGSGLTTPVRVDVEVRPAWKSTYLGGLVVDVEDVPELEQREETIVDPATGLLPAGVVATRSPAKLVVTLDRDRRTAAIDEANLGAAALVEDATEGPAPDPEALDQRRRILEGMGLPALQRAAEALELGKSGTKAELAERIARAEAANGTLIVPDDAVVKPPPPGEVKTLDEIIAAGIVQPATGGIPWDQPDADPRADLEAAVAAFEAEEPPYDGTPIDVPTVGEFLRDNSPAVREHLDRQAELLGGLSREVLRKYAKAAHSGISAAGTKGELIGRLVEVGVTVATVNDWARRNR